MLQLHLQSTPLPPPPDLVSPSQRDLMDLQPNVRAFYSSVRCLSNSSPCCTRLMRAASHSCLRSSREERWSGPPWCGAKIDQPSPRSGRFFNVLRRCSSSPLEERRRVSNCCLSVKEGVRQLTKLFNFALSQLRRGGPTIPLNFITVKAWVWSCSPNSPVATRESHWNNSLNYPSSSTTFSALVVPTICLYYPWHPRQLTQMWNPWKLAWHTSARRRERETHSTEFMLVLRITGTSTSVLSHLFISQPGCGEYEFQIYYQFRLQSLWRLRQGL